MDKVPNWMWSADPWSCSYSSLCSTQNVYTKWSLLYDCAYLSWELSWKLVQKVFLIAPFQREIIFSCNNGIRTDLDVLIHSCSHLCSCFFVIATESVPLYRIFSYCMIAWLELACVTVANGLALDESKDILFPLFLILVSQLALSLCGSFFHNSLSYCTIVIKTGISASTWKHEQLKKPPSLACERSFSSARLWAQHYWCSQSLY